MEAAPFAETTVHLDGCISQTLTPGVTRWANLLGISDSCETGPADIAAIRKVVHQVLSFSKLLQVARASYTTLEKC